MDEGEERELYGTNIYAYAGFYNILNGDNEAGEELLDKGMLTLDSLCLDYILYYSQNNEQKKSALYFLSLVEDTGNSKFELLDLIYKSEGYEGLKYFATKDVDEIKYLFKSNESYKESEIISYLASVVYLFKVIVNNILNHKDLDKNKKLFIAEFRVLYDNLKDLSIFISYDKDNLKIGLAKIGYIFTMSVDGFDKLFPELFKSTIMDYENNKEEYTDLEKINELANFAFKDGLIKYQYDFWKNLETYIVNSNYDDLNKLYYSIFDNYNENFFISSEEEYIDISGIKVQERLSAFISLFANSYLSLLKSYDLDIDQNVIKKIGVIFNKLGKNIEFNKALRHNGINIDGNYFDDKEIFRSEKLDDDKYKNNLNNNISFLLH
ncbi:hypothetical protein [Candidatus Vampirococcus lugosii]|uniref:Uncharacterized protein n=1 Tax=Candidatus Vampirococcus lugosii TaxID=2789015 RepID=A0ABS5QLF3_9BACT|nr:hypothetical protein [Candidatus Vampirococcus lugosii]MBS8122030.1 hypothetical protein [Candidatus Vampirococcus lugosii]